MVLDILFYLSILLVIGFVSFSVKPSPVYGGLALVVSGGVGCGIILGYGGSFLGLIVFLIFLGGIIVVFGYTTAIAIEQYPDTWVSNIIIWGFLLLGLLMEILLFYGWINYDYIESLVQINSMGEWVIYDSVEKAGVLGEDSVGVTAIYSYNCWLLFLAGWSILVGVLITIEITRGR